MTAPGGGTAGRPFPRPLDAVDRVEVVTARSGWLVVADKTVRRDDPYQPGHFPGLTLYPAAFLVETVRQAVGLALRERWGEWLEVESLHQLRLLRPMRDGDALRLSIAVTEDGTGLRVRAGATRADGTPVAELSGRLVRGGSDAD